MFSLYSAPFLLYPDNSAMKISSNESITELSICFISEFTATAMLVCFTCMSCINSPTFPSSLLQIALHGGFVVGVCIQCFGCISGAHINPVVSVSSFILGNISFVVLGVYVSAQFWGAIFGFALFWSFIPIDAYSSNVCLTLIHPNVTTGQAFIIEFLLTATLIFFCCGVWHEKNAKYMDSVALKFAMIVTCIILAGVRNLSYFCSFHSVYILYIFIQGPLYWCQHKPCSFLGSGSLSQKFQSSLGLFCEPVFCWSYCTIYLDSFLFAKEDEIKSENQKYCSSIIFLSV